MKTPNLFRFFRQTMLLAALFSIAGGGGARGEDAPAPAGALPFGAIAQLKVSDQSEPTYATFSADGSLLAAGGNGHIGIWNLETGNKIAELPDVRLVAASAHLKAVVGIAGHDVRIIDRRVDPPKVVASNNKNWSEYAVFAPNGKYVVIGDDDYHLHIWTADPWIEKYQITCKSPKGGNGFHVAVSPDSKLIAENVGGGFSLIEFSSGKIVFENADFNGSEMAFSLDGRTLACAYDGGAAKSHMSLWDVASRKVRATYPMDFGAAETAYLPDGLALVYRGAGMDWKPDPCAVRICDAETGAILAKISIPGSKFSNFAVSPNGKVLAAGNDQSVVFLWDIGRLILRDETLPAQLKPNDLDALWQELGGKDTVAAYKAAWKLASTGDAGVKFLQGRLHTAPRNQTKIDKLLENLDNDTEGIRNVARSELLEMGDQVEDELKKIANGPARPHAKSEATAMLALLELAPVPQPPQTPEETQHARAILALQLCGSAAACDLLKTLASAGAAKLERWEARHALKIASSTVNYTPNLGNAAPAVEANAAAEEKHADADVTGVLAAKGAEHAAAGRTEAARRFLLQALIEDEQCALALYELGKLYEKEGDPSAVDFLTRAAAVLSKQKTPDAATKLADANARLAKLNAFASQKTALIEKYADELSKLHQKYPDSMTTEDIVARAAVLDLSKTVAGAKLPTSATPPLAAPGRGVGETHAPAGPVPLDIEKALKASGWTKITGQWKKVSNGVYEVTDGKLEAEKVNGTLQLWVYKGGDGTVKAFVRDDQANFPWGRFGKYNRESFERGYGAWVKGQECFVYLPLSASAIGFAGNDVYAYHDHTVQLPDGPKHLFAVSVQDSTLEVFIDNKSDRKTSYKITKDGPFSIEIKGTVTIEDPKAIAQ